MSDKIERLTKQRDELREQANKLSEQIKELKLEELNLNRLQDKYIKYNDGFDNITYMKVDEIMKDTFRFKNFEISYMLRGIGFSYEFTGYDDATSFYWDYWYEEYIYGDERDFIKKINSIEIITEEEFDKKFEEGLALLKTYHYKHK